MEKISGIFKKNTSTNTIIQNKEELSPYFKTKIVIKDENRGSLMKTFEEFKIDDKSHFNARKVETNISLTIGENQILNRCLSNIVNESGVIKPLL